MLMSQLKGNIVLRRFAFTPDLNFRLFEVCRHRERERERARETDRESKGESQGSDRRTEVEKSEKIRGDLENICSRLYIEPLKDVHVTYVAMQ